MKDIDIIAELVYEVGIYRFGGKSEIKWKMIEKDDMTVRLAMQRLREAYKDNQVSLSSSLTDYFNK
jgi:hypothetical protein